jgi:putative endonuclease
MTNNSGTLYTDVTDDLQQRVEDHKHDLVPGFARKYHTIKLVYYEEGNSENTALAREKQIKGWKRAEKIALIESKNPEWKDLGVAWGEA